jgi:hypothetical protein
MIRVEAATPATFEEALPLLEGFDNPGIQREQWRSLFHYSWPCATELRGFVLRDGARLVGFFGTIWSGRHFQGRAERICNITSWITLPEYRNQSLRLLQAILELKDCTITCHSPAPLLYPLYQRLGFQNLETKLCVLLPLPTVRWNLRYRVLTQIGKIAHWLQGDDECILAAHRLRGCGHLLVLGPDDYCYLVYSKTKGKRVHFAHIHYLSNREVFVRTLDRIKLALYAATRTTLIMLDGRLAEGIDLPFRRDVPLRTPHVYRSGTLAPAPIDNLYSELILLGL